MKSVCLIDTSVFCNLVPVPGKDGEHAAMKAELKRLVAAGAGLLLPIATVIETGNHIGQCGSGGVRRSAAERFCELVMGAVTGDAPWVLTPPVGPDDLRQWLPGFVDHVTCGERGSGLADLCIVREWERQCQLNPGRRVFIWSLDNHLRGYDQPSKL